MNVYLDTVADRAPELALRAHHLDALWNGIEVPVVTAAEFRRFIGAMANNDPNGSWSPDGITEGDGALIYRDEFGRDEWSVVGMHEGNALYALSGWMWTR